jgi:hypothetical protein
VYILGVILIIFKLVVGIDEHRRRQIESQEVQTKEYVTAAVHRTTQLTTPTHPNQIIKNLKIERASSSNP